jgi:MFS family permease
MIVTTDESNERVGDAAPRRDLRDDDFLKLWIGETISLLGTQVTALALPLLAVITLQASAGQVGLLNACRYAPFVAVTLFAGVIVDRVRRRPTMIVANAARAFLIGLIPLAAAVDWLRVEHLYAVGFAVGVLTVFFDLAYQAYLPSLVERDLLTPANARLQASASVAELGGPGLGGLLVQVLSAPYALIADAVSFLVSVLSLTTIEKQEPAPPPTERAPLLREIGAGFRFTFANPYLRAIAGEAATFNLFEQTIMTAFVVYAIRDLDLSPGILGLVLSTGAAGALAGSLVASRLSRHFGLGPVIVGSMSVACIVPLTIALPGAKGTPTVLGLALIFSLWGGAVAVSNVLVVSLRQTVTPDPMLGRMNASYRFFTYGAIPLGALLGGGLAELIGLRPTILVGALGLTTALAWIVFSPLRGLAALPEPASPA